MVRVVKNVSWRDHLTNRKLYGHLPSLPSIVRQRRLALAGHVMIPEEPATSTRRIGRPRLTMRDVLKKDTGLDVEELVVVMKDKKTLARRFHIVTGRSRMTNDDDSDMSL